MNKREGKKQKLDTSHIPSSEFHSVWQGQTFHFVLSFLPPQEIYITCSRVCNYWHQIIIQDTNKNTKNKNNNNNKNNFWANLCFSKWPNSKDLIEIQRKEGHLLYSEIYFLYPWWVWRYHHGEPGKDNQDVFKQVWKEIESAKLSTLSKVLKTEIEEIIIETMKRIKFNLKLLETRLRKYYFPTKKIITPVDKKDINAMEETIGRQLPIVLKYFWEIIGEVDLVGRHDCTQRYKWWKAMIGKDKNISDNAFSIYGIRYHSVQHYNNNELWYLINEDETGKNGISGGFLECSLEQKDSIALKVIGEFDIEKGPITEGDFIIEMAPTFVTLIRQSLAYAGFPGMRKIPQATEIIKELSADFLLF